MANRNRVAIDESSFLVKIDDGSSTKVVIFVHGILGSAQETWGKTITTLMSSPSFATYDYGSFGYATTFIDLRRPNRGTDALLPWVRAHLKQYKSIYFVAHSMGGLVTREAVIKLLSESDGYELAARIRACFLVASPVTGSPLATWMNRIGLGWLNRRVGYLAKPRVYGKDLGQAYLDAARQYILNKRSKADIPRFYYFIGEADKLVFEPQATFYTEYDKFAGRFPGSHSGIKDEVDENSTVLVRIRDLIEETEARETRIQEEKTAGIIEATVKREEGASNHEAPRRWRERVESEALAPAVRAGRRPVVNVLLISCSKTKSDAGQIPHPRNGGMREQVADARMAELAFDLRGRIRRAIQAGDVDGVEFREGNRVAVRANRALIHGPDFGGVLNDNCYLPAYLRYSGRCFQATGDEWANLFHGPTRPSVLIMSGLYGLIPADEYIQNYDVHLTDVDIKREVTLHAQWRDRELMTQMLASHLEWIDNTRGSVGVVVDALSELSYQETINWGMIDARWPVLHRVFRERAGRQALANLGEWIRDVIRTPQILDNIQREVFYPNPNFIEQDEIAFEERIGASSLAVARQVEPA